MLPATHETPASKPRRGFEQGRRPHVDAIATSRTYAQIGMCRKRSGFVDVFGNCGSAGMIRNGIRRVLLYVLIETV